MNTKKHILAVGSIAIDSVETPFDSQKDIMGGSASFFAISAGLLTKVKLVGVVGNDYPKKWRDIFVSRKINLDNVQTKQGKTFRWGGKYNNDFSTRETLFTELGVFESFVPEIIENDCDTPLVFLGNIQPELQLNVAKKIHSPEFIISDTMNLWIDLFPDKLNSVIKKSDVFFVNHEEAEQITGLSSVKESAKKFLEMGPRAVVIKMGAEGSYLAYEDSSIHVPVYPIKKLIDPTGAGDSFAGGFISYLATNDNPNFINAVVAGTAMASFCVEGFGLESLLKATPKMLFDRIQTINNMLSEKNYK